jgi:hypothetical protein
MSERGSETDPTHELSYGSAALGGPLNKAGHVSDPD